MPKIATDRDSDTPYLGQPVLSPAEPDPTDPLVAALDRLRTTGDRPADMEIARMLRGRREYAAPEPEAEVPPSEPATD